MPEKKIEVKRFLIYYECDDCEDGQMMVQANGHIMGPNKQPLKLQYICDRCGSEKYMKAVYPSMGEEVPENVRMPLVRNKKK